MVTSVISVLRSDNFPVGQGDSDNSCRATLSAKKDMLAAPGCCKHIITELNFTLAIKPKLMINIALVEDHNIVRNGIKTLLDNERDMSIVADANNAEEIMAMLEKGLEVDMILTDINMPGTDGLTVTKIITEVYPHIRTVILSMYDQFEYINQAFKSGARGYLLKNASPDELIFAIRHIFLKEERYICTELSLRMLDRQIQAADIIIPDDTEFDFSRKEIEVLSLVSEGYTNQEIAERLYTSKRTVEGYRQTLIEKTGVRNSSALIRYAIVNGLIK